MKTPEKIYLNRDGLITFSTGIPISNSTEYIRADKAKSEAEKLAKALRQIETECDNQNPTHESIWHLAYNAIHDHNSRKK